MLVEEIVGFSRLLCTRSCRAHAYYKLNMSYWSSSSGTFQRLYPSCINLWGNP